jgi:transcription elongation GreA/GreB family factor
MWIFRSAAAGCDRPQDCRRGATNYITARGAKRLRDELQELRGANAVSECVTELEEILTSVHVVDPPDAPFNSVTFGTTVTVKDKNAPRRCSRVSSV